MISQNAIKKCFAICFMLPLAALAETDSKKYLGHIGLIGKVGTERSLTRFDLMIPVLQNDKSLFFVDIRGVLSTKDTQEGNFGLGYRQKLVNTPLILGGYAFYDVIDSENSNTFHQITIGAEALGEKWTARANGYISLSGKARVKDDDDAFAQGNNIIVKEGYERSLHGFDVEVGRTIDPVPGLSAFLGAYHFDNDEVENITGGRARLEYSFKEMYAANNEIGHPLLNKLTLTGEVQYDGERGQTAFVGARYLIPLGKPAAKPLSRLDRRMTEVVMRDIDIVINNNQENGLAQNRLGETLTAWHVDNTNSEDGDGSFENPFKTLKQAELASAPHDLIHIRVGDNTTTGQDEGIILKEGQILHGHGANVIQTTQSGDNLVVVRGLEQQAEFSKITNNAGNGIIAKDHNVIRGIEITDAQSNGIYGLNSNWLNINNVNLIDNTDSGIGIDVFETEDADLTINISNVVAQGNNTGILLRNNSFSGITTGSINISDTVALNNNNGIALEFSAVTDNLMKTNLNNITTSSQNANSVGINVVSNATNELIELAANNITNNNNTSLGMSISSMASGENRSKIELNNINTNETLNGTGTFIRTAGNFNYATTSISNMVSNNNAITGLLIGNIATTDNAAETNLNTIAASFNPSDNIQIVNLASNGDNTSTIQLDTISTNNSKSANSIGSGVIIFNDALGLDGSGDNRSTININNIESNENGFWGLQIFNSTPNGSNYSDITLNNITTLENNISGVSFNVSNTMDNFTKLTIDNLRSIGNDVGLEIFKQTAETNQSELIVTNSQLDENRALGLNLIHNSTTDNSTIILENVTANANSDIFASGIRIAKDSSNDASILTFNNVTAEGNELNGIALTHTVDGTNSAQISLKDLNVSHNNNSGLFISHLSNIVFGAIDQSTLKLEGITANHNDNASGIFIEKKLLQTDESTTLLENITANNNAGSGIEIINNTFDAEHTIQANEINVRDNLSAGLRIDTNAQDDLTRTTTLTNINATGNEGAGIEIEEESASASMSELMMSDITSMMNVGSGIAILQLSNGPSAVESNITIEDALLIGNNFGLTTFIRSLERISNETSVALNNITANQNNAPGILIFTQSSFSENASEIEVVGSTTNENAGTGISIRSLSSAKNSSEITLESHISQENAVRGANITINDNSPSVLGTTSSSIQVLNSEFNNNATSEMTMSADSGLRIDIGQSGDTPESLDTIIIEGNQITNHQSISGDPDRGIIIDIETAVNNITINNVDTNNAEASLLNDNLLNTNDVDVEVLVTP